MKIGTWALPSAFPASQESAWLTGGLAIFAELDMSVEGWQRDVVTAAHNLGACARRVGRTLGSGGENQSIQAPEDLSE